MRYLLTILFAIVWAGTSAADVVCVSRDTAPVLASPWEGALVRLEIPLNFPLASGGEKDSFVNVSDYRGRTGWVAAGDIASSACVVVARNHVNVRTGPGTTHEVVFKARRGVAFQLLEAADDWARVRHESGRTGWIFKKLLWGAL